MEGSTGRLFALAALASVLAAGCGSNSTASGPWTPTPSGSCGVAGGACCATSPSCNIGLGCVGGTCAANGCGVEGAACCESGGCTGQSLVCLGNICRNPTLACDPFAASEVASPFTRQALLVDITRDGIPDLVTVGDERYDAYVHAGNADGTFKARVAWSTRASFVLVDDVNGDGSNELLTAHAAQSTVTIQSVPSSAITVNGMGWGTRGLAVADLNGDGKKDIVSAAPLDHTVNVALFSAATGRWVAAAYAAGSSPRAVAIADLNGDGNPDLAAADNGFTGGTSRVQVLLGAGDGTFGAATPFVTNGMGATGVVAADLNGDGRLDLAASNESPGARRTVVSVLLGAGDGTFAAGVPYEVLAGASGVAVNDVDGDLKLDLVVPCPDADAVSVLLGKGDGTFQPRTDYAVGAGASSVVFGDVNKDGRSDLVIAQSRADSVRFVLGNGDGTFQSSRVADGGQMAAAARLADLDADGKLDLAVVDELTGKLRLLFGTGDGGFGGAVDVATGAGPNAVAVGDFDGNGRRDAAVSNSAPGTVTVALLALDRSVTVNSLSVNPGAYPGAYPTAIAVARLNADDLDDLAVASVGAPPAVSVFLASGSGAFESKVDYPVGDAPQAITAADVNADGAMDLLVAHGTSLGGGMTLLLGKGDGTFTAGTAITSSRIVAVEAARLDGDANLDLVLLYGPDNYGGLADVYLGAGNGTFQISDWYSTGIGANGLAVADLDGDSDADLAVSSHDGGNVDLYANYFGLGQFSLPAAASDVAWRAGPVPQPSGVLAGDVNGDGRMDLAVPSNQDGGVRVFLNRCGL
ncbi:MAG TPA: VCBS repeat-containing protein [Anaeromyxobacteraceae bacterium]|nr:VCBS repeat-containing protein [Anaeromyxobacteraceae bacterium]